MPAISTNSKPQFTDKDLCNLKAIRRFREHLGALLETGEHPLHRSFADPARRLLLGDYLSLFLLGLLNPVARTMRGLVHASALTSVQRGICGRAVSLGSFSETQALVDPALLERMFAELAAELPDVKNFPRSDVHRFFARDSSLFPALPRMAWALYGGGREGFVNNAVRLHVSFDLQKDAPAQVRITTGKICERAALRLDLAAGSAYVADRYFGEHYALFGELSAKGCRYIIRLIDHRCTEPQILEEHPISEADKACGIERQATVILGKENKSEALRLIWLRGCTGQLLHIATNLRPEELSAGDIALMYKERWKVEYFFRWVKCLMGCGHWLAESPRGVAVQLYLALIGALLLQLELGRRPSKRIWELLQWHLVGMLDQATLTERLAAQLASEEQSRAKATAKKTSAQK